MVNHRLFLSLSLGLGAACLPLGAALAQTPTLTQSTPVRVFDSAPSYVNDHTFVKGPDGSWNLFGIYHDEPADPEHESEFVHAVHASGDPSGWQTNSFTVDAQGPIALREDSALGETHLWAPHVVWSGHDYVMVYQSGGTDDDHAAIRLARSPDLVNWRRTGELFTDFCVARDPMLKRVGALWALYYTRCDDPASRRSGVAYRTSSDLRRWSAPAMALVLAATPSVFNSGYTESPFVFEKNGWFYLSVTSYPVDYRATFVFRSRSPFQFSDTPIARLAAHAAEWLEDREGQLFMSSAGWGQGGVWLSRVSGF